MDHLHHCVDLLRQTLMCNAKLDLNMYEWWELALNPAPNFKVTMKYRNYDAILDWEDRPIEESGFIRWYEDGWMDGWGRQGCEKNVNAPWRWWELQLSEGGVSEGNFERDGEMDELADFLVVTRCSDLSMTLPLAGL